MKRKEYTISDIAKALHISTASVSRALSGSSGVGEELRDKILKFCNEIGYRPPGSIRQSFTENTHIIALIMGDMGNPFYADLANIIQKHLAKHNYMMVLFNSEYNTEQELEFIKKVELFHFDGLILITAQDKAISQKLERLPIPKVLVNRIIPDYSGSSVLTDNFQAGYEAALHLINLGHKEIGFIEGPSSSSASTQRYSGFCQAMQNYNLPVKEEYIWKSNLKLEDGKQLSKEFLQLVHRPTAVIIVNDMTSIGFMDGCIEEGLHIPDELSIIGFDDISISSLHSIQLTTVSQHAEEMGRIASELMIKQLTTSHSQPERVILKPSLIIRNTTAPVR